jgi:UDP-N-acetylglucosamine--N-acetylmuramyl-(pentapeptide) pyrophosphoryl-undecaprenol N-acetylglucosamine transferase
MTKKKILIATGGTGGHIFPACSLAKYLISSNFKVKLTTDIRGQRFIKNKEDLDYIILPSSPLIKNNIFKILSSILINLFSFLRSLFFLLFYRPAIVFGMGGYASFPICIAASILRIKIILYENNLIIGKANRYLIPLAKKIFVSYKELEGIPKKYNKKILEIGNIIRKDIINSNIVKQNLNHDDIKILVLGGSQAAKVFAQKLPQIFKKLKVSGLSIKVYQQCIKNQNDQLSHYYEQAGIEHEIFNFTDNIIDYYSKINLAITRSGASVLGELINVNVPFIAIPLPTSADNHQYRNAEFYFKKGYGYLLTEKDIEEKLFSLIKTIFMDKSSIEKILSNQRQYSDKDIFRNLHIQIERILNEKN